MKHLYALRAWSFALKVAFIAFGLLAIWIMAGIAENPASWWLYALASLGSACIALLLLGAGVGIDDKLDAAERRHNAVPVPRIERR